MLWFKNNDGKFQPVYIPKLLFQYLLLSVIIERTLQSQSAIAFVGEPEESQEPCISSSAYINCSFL